MFLDIDVSQKTLDVALLEEESKPCHKDLPNTPVRHRQLLAWLRQQGVEVAHACLEATGTWADAAALALLEAGHNKRGTRFLWLTPL